MLSRGGAESMSGQLAFGLLSVEPIGGAAAPRVVPSARMGASLADNYGAFADGGGVLTTSGGDSDAPHAAAAALVELPPATCAALSFGLAWYFPHRLWFNMPDDNVSQVPNYGQFYSNFYDNASHVLASFGARLPQVAAAAANWHAIAGGAEGFGVALRDSLINSPASWGKTAVWLRDGRWRQFESHSCAQMEPPHIHFYRALGYSLFMPSIERQTPEMYARGIDADGYVEELFGCDCVGCHNETLDRPGGSPVGIRGDDNLVFVLDVYMNWRWKAGGGDAWMRGRWPSARLAANWSMATATEGLPTRLFNTYETGGSHPYSHEGDVNPYNGMLYLSALAAAAEMAAAVGDHAFATRCTAALEAGRTVLATRLWVEAGDGGASEGYWRAAWCRGGANGTALPALQAGVLYGLMWARVLGLSDAVGIDDDKVRQHLKAERARCTREYGLIFVANRTVCEGEGGAAAGAARLGAQIITDEDAWAETSMTHAALSVAVGLGSTADALAVAELVLDSYRTVLNDQWDYRDTTGIYDDGSADKWGLRPKVNSHYSRQTWWWAIPLALTGQQYDARTRTLSLAPDAAVAARFPLLLPDGSAQLTRGPDGCYHAEVLSGAIGFGELSLTVHGVGFAPTPSARGEWRVGEVARLCPASSKA